LGNQFILESTTHATLLSLKNKAGPMGGGGGPRKVGPTGNYTGTIQ
jgi:hypothetical protein